MREISPDPDNNTVITEFGHRRFAYELSADVQNDVRLEIVLQDEILRRVAIVPDYYSLFLRHGIDVDYSKVSSSTSERQEALFFLPSGVVATSSPAALV